MKKVLIIAAMFAIVACGQGANTKKEAAQTHSTCSSECTEDHSKTTTPKKEDTHKHADGESCSGNHDAAPVADAEHNHAEGEECTGGDEHAHPDPNFKEVQLTDSQAKEADIKVYHVKATDNFSSVIKTTGKVSSNNTDKKVIVAPTSGIVNLVAQNLVDGVSIEKGKNLLSISSDKMEGGDIMIKTAARYEAAKSDFERASKLIGDLLISQTDYNNIKLTYTTVKTEYDAMKNRHGEKGVKVSSPIKGYLTELLVKDGQYVEAGTPIMIVSAGNKSILTAYVSERHYGRLKNIVGANFKTAYNNNVYDIKELGGKVLAYGKGENDDTYLIPVTFEFNSNADILPGSFVEVFLKEKPRTGSVVVPVAAITEEQNVYYVYTHRGEQLYRKVEVKLGESDGKFIEVISGVNNGDKVVVSGTYQIKLASSSGVIPAACGHSH